MSRVTQDRSGAIRISLYGDLTPTECLELVSTYHQLLKAHLKSAHNRKKVDVHIDYAGVTSMSKITGQITTMIKEMNKIRVEAEQCVHCTYYKNIGVFWKPFVKLTIAGVCALVQTTIKHVVV